VIRYHAPWVLPISGPPVRDGWVAVEDGRIVATGHGLPQNEGAELLEAMDHDLGDVVLMPGLVNAHTHLELSYLRGLVSPTGSFVDWIRQVIVARRRYPDPNDPVISQGVSEAIAEARRSGTALVGDISNTLVTFDQLANSPLAAVVFYELIGFRCSEPEAVADEAMRRLGGLAESSRVRTSLAAHAPYSVAPKLFGAIRDAVDRARLELPYSVHLSESAEEVQFIKSADGPWRALLDEMDVWEPSWIAPGVSPVEYLAQQGFLGPRAIVVHGVQMSAIDLGRLAECATTLVVCPRSNVYTGVGAPPLEQFYASGVHVALGTDSLASAPNLNVFDELAAMRALAPSIPAAALLDSATRQGASALGFAADYGTIEPGKRAALVAVSMPTSVMEAADVEEYLLSGIQPDRISWL
jgi:cytosine/adenosine deaminase-related metal-dependent hydrolase